MERVLSSGMNGHMRVVCPSSMGTYRSSMFRNTVGHWCRIFNEGMQNIEDVGLSEHSNENNIASVQYMVLKDRSITLSKWHLHSSSDPSHDP
ncbi:hypothetical protein TNCV_3797871 [Trichonephila clavipes]|nr:hypothetical protein TNCV_3797871 [Trichonephila clavipes]